MRRLFLAIAALVLFVFNAPALAQHATRMRLLTSPNSSGVGQTVTLTAELDAFDGADPEGFVDFNDGSSSLGRVDLQGTTFGVIAAGAGHSCVVTSAGGAKCWGLNSAGQLGDGTTVTRLAPTNVSGLTSGIVVVAAGARHSCAITEAGGVKCWGANDFGQLGDGTTMARRSPVGVSGLSGSIVAVVAGYAHTCALTTTGAVKCWGLNNYGQVGDGTTSIRLTPVGVSSLSRGVIAISAGNAHSCALTYAYSVQCWGKNDRGQLGNGTTINRPTPVTVASLGNTVLHITSGGDHNCAGTSNSAKCWGRNDFGQLGDGSHIDRHTPVSVRAPVTSPIYGRGLFAGQDHTCTSGVLCWGRRFQPTPTQVFGFYSSVAHVAGGWLHTCAATRAGAFVQCWGNNVFGQIGDGTTNYRPGPTVASNVIPIVRRAAQIKTSNLVAGTHALTARFHDPHNRTLPSSSTATQVVLGADGAP
jgi:alpha-tubulin suppressor-like RCC1 family protein